MKDIFDFIEPGVPFFVFTYVYIVNVCIGCYIGWFGLDGFFRPRPIGYMIAFFGTGSGLVLSYAQENYGYNAEPRHIFAIVGIFVVAFIVTKAWRTSLFCGTGGLRSGYMRKPVKEKFHEQELVNGKELVYGDKLRVGDTIKLAFSGEEWIIDSLQYEGNRYYIEVHRVGIDNEVEFHNTSQEDIYPFFRVI